MLVKRSTSSTVLMSFYARWQVLEFITEAKSDLEYRHDSCSLTKIRTGGADEDSAGLGGLLGTAHTVAELLKELAGGEALKLFCDAHSASWFVKKNSVFCQSHK